MEKRVGPVEDGRDARIVSLVDALVLSCETVARALPARRVALGDRIQHEGRSAHDDVLAALREPDAAERARLLRSALYATRQVERLFRTLRPRSLPADFVTRTTDMIIALRMEFLRRLLPPP